MPLSVLLQADPFLSAYLSEPLMTRRLIAERQDYQFTATQYLDRAVALFQKQRAQLSLRQVFAKKDILKG
jgi:hypothetical protein